MAKLSKLLNRHGISFKVESNLAGHFIKSTTSATHYNVADEIVNELNAIKRGQESSHEETAALPLQNVNNWVAVKDQLPPDESKQYLVVRDGNVEFDKWIFNGTEGFWWDYMGITHWMQIPEPPCC